MDQYPVIRVLAFKSYTNILIKGPGHAPYTGRRYKGAATSPPKETWRGSSGLL